MPFFLFGLVSTHILGIVLNHILGSVVPIDRFNLSRTSLAVFIHQKYGFYNIQSPIVVIPRSGFRKRAGFGVGQTGDTCLGVPLGVIRACRFAAKSMVGHGWRAT